MRLVQHELFYLLVFKILSLTHLSPPCPILIENGPDTFNEKTPVNVAVFENFAKAATLTGVLLWIRYIFILNFAKREPVNSHTVIRITGVR